MLREINVGGLRIDNALGALLQSGFEEGYYVCRLASKLVCEFFTV